MASTPDPERAAPDAESAFVELRPLLLGVAYRMLSSAVEAEDVVQDAYLRWRGVEHAAVRSPRAYLTTMVTRMCIDRATAAKSRRESYVGQWLPEPIVADRDPVELSDSLSLAFLVLLEELGPLERAAFLLHDVFGYAYGEVAEITGTTEANCRQLVSRGRRRMAERRRRFDADEQASRRLAERFVAACAGGDLDELMGLLAPDVVVWSDGGGVARAAPRPVVGARRAGRFLVSIAKSAAEEATGRLVHINGQPGVVLDVGGRAVVAVALDVVDGTIIGVRIVSNPHKLTAVQPGCPGFLQVITRPG